MSVYDIRFKEEWQKILDNISQELGMPAAVLDEKTPYCRLVESEMLFVQKSGQSRNH